MVALAPLLAAGCASRVGPDGLAVGGPCVDEFDCVTGSFCLGGSRFPAGTCSTICRSTGECRADSVCVDLESGVCLLPCAVDADCERSGYVCHEEALRDGTGRASVCVGR